MSNAALPEQASKWCVSSVHQGFRLLEAQQLFGGQCAIVHLLTLELVSSEKRELVLRRFVRDWNPVSREVAALQVLDHFHSPQLGVPRLVAFDATGEDCGAPAVLLTRVPGHIDLGIEGAQDRARQLGAALATLHIAKLACSEQAPELRFELENELKPRPPGALSADWPRAFAALRDFQSTALRQRELLHGDFHMGNTLFTAGQLSGVIDWSDVKCGASAFDVGYCRADLALLFGLAEADAFYAEYQGERGAPLADLPLWDLAGAACAYPDPCIWLPGWRGAGRTELTAELLQRRLQQFAERALARL